MGSIFTNGETKPLFSELHGAPLPTKLPFMLDRFNANAESHADKLAVISYHQRNDLYEDILGQLPEIATSQHLRWPFSRLQALTRRFAAALMVMGVTKGTTIATFIDNSVEWPMCFWACLQLGCPIVPLNPRSLSNHEEISHMLRVSGAKVLFVRDHQLARKMDTELSDISQTMTLKIVINSDGSDSVLSSTWIPLTDLLAASDPQNVRSPPAFDYEPDPEDLSVIIYTSGTTSLPKGCPNKNRHISILTHTYRTRANIDHTCVSLAVLPNSHLMGMLAGIMNLSEGATVVYPAPTFQPKETLRALMEEGITHFMTVPPIVLAMVEQVERSGMRPTTLRRMDCSGAAVTPEIVRICTQIVGA